MKISVYKPGNLRQTTNMVTFTKCSVSRLRVVFTLQIARWHVLQQSGLDLIRFVKLTHWSSHLGKSNTFDNIFSNFLCWTLSPASSSPNDKIKPVRKRSVKLFLQFGPPTHKLLDSHWPADVWFSVKSFLHKRERARETADERWTIAR